MVGAPEVSKELLLVGPATEQVPAFTLVALQVTPAEESYGTVIFPSVPLAAIVSVALAMTFAVSVTETGAADVHVGQHANV